MLSSRTAVDLAPNRLAQALAEARRERRPVLDLTESNPTRAGFEYPQDLLASLAHPRALTYSPQPVFVVRPTTDRQQLLSGVDRVFANAGKGARFVDAVSEAVARIDKEKGDFFYTLMFLATNGPEGSTGNLDALVDDVQKRIARRPIMVHVLLLSAGPRVLQG